ncbi:polysaccharide deacetylase family protein [Streptomyces sp. TRM66268-LWL]|uniref:Polysaccharide deacetylase family protein n=1 Tax=Streptomyces polyasparticus TaxID=2767826 RepID=A0ABR7SZ78_9ACTN|nr:polysaccharide deacetylase family protein [Streptomyces polyasparticus]MBC9719573.1 polysaccharide deacetylase family protein [Streptomyces polyasparticus]
MSRRLKRTFVTVAAIAVLAACGTAEQPDTAAGKAAAAASPVAAPLKPKPSPSPSWSKPRPMDCRKARCVALTFDAGPGPYTARLLDILKTKRVNATFFLLGKSGVTRYPELVRREAAEGHELANHSWSHPRLTEVSDTEIRRQLSLVQKQIKDLTGRTPTLMRPPQGRTDQRVAKVSRELGLAQILWTVTAKDYRDHDPRLIQRRVLASAARNGIILLHDIYPGTVPAVPGIIDGLRERGLTPVTVSQLFAPNKPRPGRAYWNAW